MDTLSVLIKPASGRCNLRCKYCFYEDVAGQRSCFDCGFMDEDLLEKLVRQAMEIADRRVGFAFQGGEPMLRGLPFYRKLIELEQKYVRPGLIVEHSIQTNGTLIDEEWASFFEEHNFLVGLSIDGTRDNHDLNRVDALGSGTWKSVEHAWRLLAKHVVETNAVCVVTGFAARRGQAIYQNLKKLGFRFLQFIPCLDPMGKERGGEHYSLTPEQYGRFLRTVFDLWYRDWECGDYVSVRMFDDLVHILAGQTPGTCATNGTCGRYLVVEGDGSVYPCDFFVLDQWRLGSLAEQHLKDMWDAPLAERFCACGRGYPPKCVGCRWLPLCHGGCQRDWVDHDRNYHCEALSSFFEYAFPRLRHMAELEQTMLSR